jgi:hypothetical protein
VTCLVKGPSNDHLKANSCIQQYLEKEDCLEAKTKLALRAFKTHSGNKFDFKKPARL